MSVQIPSRRVTSADVAREAGVSRTTVSYVLNNTAHQKIPEDTRQRVLDAAARLAYAPSPAAIVGFDDFTREETAAMFAAGINSVVSLAGGSGRGREFGIGGQRIGRLQAEHLIATGHERLGYARPEDERVQMIAPTRLG